MDFYLTELTQNSTIKTQLRLPMNPERITVASGIQSLDFNILNKGEIKIPNGMKLDTASWEAILPGEGLKSAPYVKSWKNPNEIHKQIKAWMANKTKLRLMVTETPILMDVCIEEYSPEFGMVGGSINYKISFYESKDLIVTTQAEATMQVTAKKYASVARATPASAKTYTVKAGDTLWKIALSQLKNGSRYTEIAKLNAIKNANLIYPGQVLKLPTA